VRPVVTKLAPATGPAAGGTTITITGKNLLGVTSVNFGPTPAVGIHVLSATSMTATSAPGSAGVYDVTVTSPGGTSLPVAKDRFKFGSPTVTTVSPATGAKAGGTAVTVTGTGFAPGAGRTVFEFGKSFATEVSCSSTSRCTLLTPAGKVGTVDILALVGNARSGKVPADRYTYN